MPVRSDISSAHAVRGAGRWLFTGVAPGALTGGMTTGGAPGEGATTGAPGPGGGGGCSVGLQAAGISTAPVDTLPASSTAVSRPGRTIRPDGPRAHAARARN